MVGYTNTALTHDYFEINHHYYDLWQFSLSDTVGAVTFQNLDLA